MTKTEANMYSLDRQVISNTMYGSKRYIRIGRSIYSDQERPRKIDMVKEDDRATWTLGGQVTRWYKLKLQFRIMMQLWRSIK